MDKLGNLIVQAIEGYLKKKPIRKKLSKKNTSASPQKSPKEISVSQVVNVGSQAPMNEADAALGRMKNKPGRGLFL
jgi:hypothetical protein